MTVYARAVAIFEVDEYKSVLQNVEATSKSLLQ